MKITYLLSWPHEVGGTERSVITQAGAMADRHQVEIVGVLSARSEPFFPIPSSVAHRVLVQLDGDGAPVAAQGVELPLDRLAALHEAPSRLVTPAWESAFSQLTDLAVSRWISALDCDVLVTTTPPLLAMAAQLAPDAVVVVHQEHRTSERRGGSLPPLVTHGPRVDAVAFLTAATADHFRALWGTAQPLVLQSLNPLPPEPRPVSRHGRPLIAAAGRLSDEKQFDHLIDAFAPVAAENPEWVLRIFGTGPREAALRRQIARLGMTDRIELMGASATMSAEWASASIVALTSRSEGLSLVLQEAMAAGVAVVSYDCPHGPGELISHGQDGLLVEDQRVDRLSDALSALVADPGRRRQLGAAARRRARDFHAGTIARRWEAHFEALLADRRPGESRLERVIRRGPGVPVPVSP
jgi:glycosyltransferase involved in cell wall biosynthesis